MSARNKKILISVIVIITCLTAVAVTLALTLTQDDGGHIKIEDGGIQTVQGELDIVLKRERLKTVTLDKNGLAYLSEDKAIKDFSKSSDNVFGIDDSILIGPKCYFEASMVISNSKPYPFEYWLEIIPINGDKLLADQLMLTVTVDDELFIQHTLNDGLQTKVIALVASGHNARFTVKLEYLDVHNNDETKNTTLAFDIIVHARLTES